MSVEIKRQILQAYKTSSSSLEKALYECVLQHWGDIEGHIETALLNHRFRKLTIPIVCKGLARGFWVFLRFTIYNNGEWDLDNVFVGPSVGWPYKWKIVVEGEGARLYMTKKTVRLTQV